MRRYQKKGLKFSRMARFLALYLVAVLLSAKPAQANEESSNPPEENGQTLNEVYLRMHKPAGEFGGSKLMSGGELGAYKDLESLSLGLNYQYQSTQNLIKINSFGIEAKKEIYSSKRHSLFAALGAGILYATQDGGATLNGITQWYKLGLNLYQNQAFSFDCGMLGERLEVSNSVVRGSNSGIFFSISVKP